MQVQIAERRIRRGRRYPGRC